MAPLVAAVVVVVIVVAVVIGSEANRSEPAMAIEAIVVTAKVPTAPDEFAATVEAAFAPKPAFAKGHPTAEGAGIGAGIRRGISGRRDRE